MATIKDIAKITGCSVMTVSRALNNPELVKKETLDRIMEAVESTGYVQNRVARSLIKGCTYNICVYIPAALDATEPGEFSDRVWTLDNRRLYKPQTADKDGK